MGGALLSYGPDHRDPFRRATTYADKLLKGARRPSISNGPMGSSAAHSRRRQQLSSPFTAGVPAPRHAVPAKRGPMPWAAATSGAMTCSCPVRSVQPLDNLCLARCPDRLLRPRGSTNPQIEIDRRSWVQHCARSSTIFSCSKLGDHFHLRRSPTRCKLRMPHDSWRRNLPYLRGPSCRFQLAYRSISISTMCTTR